MKDILEYTDYRQYIADYYADRKAKSAFSWQEFATAAGFSSPVYLKYVSEGRFNLSEDAALRTAQAMHLADFECKFFVEMVKFDHAKNDAEKRAAFSNMISIADSNRSAFLKTGKIQCSVNLLLLCLAQNPWLLLTLAALKSLRPKLAKR